MADPTRKPRTLLLRAKDPALYQPDAAGGRPPVAWHSGKPGEAWRFQWATVAGVKASRMALVLALNGKALLLGCAVADLDRGGLQSMLDAGDLAEPARLAAVLRPLGKLMVLDESGREIE